jgi:hypothetical protein
MSSAAAQKHTEVELRDLPSAEQELTSEQAAETEGGMNPQPEVPSRRRWISPTLGVGGLVSKGTNPLE